MSDQPLNDAWGQGADGKWYPPEQLWGRALSPDRDEPSPWGAPPQPVATRAPRWPWVAVALGGLVSFVLLAIIGAVVVDAPGEVDASARSVSSTTSELAGVTSSTTTTTTSTTSTTAPPTTAPPTTEAPSTTAAPPPPAPPPPAPTTAVPPPPAVAAPTPADIGVYYENCAAARAAGAAPVYRGEPGYARHLDRDDDGVGCE